MTDPEWEAPLGYIAKRNTDLYNKVLGRVKAEDDRKMSFGKAVRLFNQGRFRDDYLNVLTCLAAIMLSMFSQSIEKSTILNVCLADSSRAVWILNGTFNLIMVFSSLGIGWFLRNRMNESVSASDYRTGPNAIIFNKPHRKKEGENSTEEEKREEENRALNEPWILYNADTLKAKDPLLQFESYKKLFIMGRCKVGKTQLAKWIGMKDAMPHNNINTRGELFYFPDGPWRNWMVIDSEGFDQPINTVEPEFKKVFITEHAKSFADVIVIVMPQLLISDLELYLTQVESLLQTTRKIIIVHNLQTFKTQHEITVYKKMFAKHIHEHYRFCGDADWREGNLSFSHFIHEGEDRVPIGLAVNHYFLGNHDSSDIMPHNFLQLFQMRDAILQSGNNVFRHEKLLKTLTDSITFTGKLSYSFAGNESDVSIKPLDIENFDDVPFEWNHAGTTTVKGLKFEFIPPIQAAIWLTVGNSRYLGSELLYSWGAPVERNLYNGNMTFLPLFIRLSRLNTNPIDATGPCIDVTIEARLNRLLVRYRQWKYTYPRESEVSVNDLANFQEGSLASQYIKIPGGYTVIALPAIPEDYIEKIERTQELSILVPVLPRN